MPRQFHLPILVMPMLVVFVQWALPLASAWGVEHVLLQKDGKTRQLKGQVIVEFRDDALLLEAPDGALWPIEPGAVRNRKSDEKPFVRLDKNQLAKQLLEELGPDFQVHHSKNYVVCYNTTPKYARWCSSLLERLQKAFLAYWKKRGCEVHAPKSPLIVVVFGDKASYMRYARPELGPAGGSAIGFYSILTNRIAMYDLTGMQALQIRSGRRSSAHDISTLLSQPEAEPLVATIVHEATHQISFNCGLQTRLAPNPVWLSEGLAVYFETPDLSSSRSWRGVGNVNYSRWDRFRANVHSGRVGTLQSLIKDDHRIRNPSTAVDAYAEAWAWNYFLIRWRPEQYTSYLKMLAAKPRLTIDKPSTRLSDFKQHFGNDLDALKDDFYRRMTRVK